MIHKCNLLKYIIIYYYSNVIVGGGTIRDVLVLNKQPFWVEEWEYLLISCAAAAGLFYCWDSMAPGKEVLPGLVIKSSNGGEGNAMGNY